MHKNCSRPEIPVHENTSLRHSVGRWTARIALVAAGGIVALGGGTAAEAGFGAEARAEASSPLDSMNGAEKAWCRWPSRWKLCTRARELANESLMKANEVAHEYNRSIHNGDADAFRHCYWSGRMTQELGAETAKGFGDRHEYNEEQHPFEAKMDLHNNLQGRIWAQESHDIGARCLEGMVEGDLWIVIPFAR